MMSLERDSKIVQDLGATIDRTFCVGKNSTSTGTCAFAHFFDAGKAMLELALLFFMINWQLFPRLKKHTLIIDNKEQDIKFGALAER